LDSPAIISSSLIKFLKALGLSFYFKQIYFYFNSFLPIYFNFKFSWFKQSEF